MGKRPDMKKRMGRGADIFFEDTSTLDTDNDNIKDANKSSIKDIGKDSIQDTSKDNKQSTIKRLTQMTDKDTTQHTTDDTTQYTDKYTIEMPDTGELYSERLVANVTRSQKKYVEQTAKKHKLNNSEFVRFMIDFFIDNFEIK